MPFKWVGCMVCARTMHIGAFPEPVHREIKKLGYGTCKRCDGASYADILTSTTIIPIHEFIKACEADR